MLAADERPDVADLLVDRRATHYWDGEEKLGRDVGRIIGQDGSTAWDIFLVYGPDAKWGDPPDAVGSPVVAEGEGLRRALDPYLDPT
jgi:putative intracellular protease/amidase